MHPPSYVLTISGSDSSGRAGMQADNRAIHAVGGFPLNVVTAVTLQAPKGVESVQLMAPDYVEAQLRSMLKSYRVRAIKSGMLGSAAIAHRVAAVLAEYPEVPYVLDPVMCASSGAMLLEAEGVEVVRGALMQRAYLTTPNLDELAVLTGAVDGDAWQGAAELAELVEQSILLKGGHASGDICEDWLFYADGRRYCFREDRVDTRNTRGTGCALSSLIAAHLASEPYELEDAIRSAKHLLTDSLEENRHQCWKGGGPSFNQTW